MSDFKINILGNADGLKDAANEAAGILDGLSSGGVDGLSNAFGGLLGKLGPLGVAAGAALTALTALVTGGAKLAAEFGRLSAESGIAATQLQKLERAFGGVGLAAAELVDINRDAMDKLGDAWQNGGGVADDLKSAGLNIKQFGDLLNDPQGGIKAATRAFYEMTAAGKSQAEIIQVMESLASNSSKMIGELKNYNSEAEAMVSISEKAAYVADDTAQAYADAGGKLADVGKHVMGFFAEMFDFIPKGFNMIYDYFAKDFGNTKFALSIKALSRYIGEVLPKAFTAAVDGIKGAAAWMTKIFDSVKNTILGLYNKMVEIMNKVTSKVKGAAEFLGFDVSWMDEWDKAIVDTGGNIIDKIAGGWDQVKSSINGAIEEQRKFEQEQTNQKIAEYNNNVKTGQTTANQTVCPTCKKPHGANECPELAKKKKAAQKVAQEAQKAREKAYKDLEALNIALYNSAQAAVASSNRQITENLAKLDNALKQGIITQEQYEQKRRELIDANADNFRKSILGANPADALQMLAASRQVYEQSVSDLELMFKNKLIKEAEYLQRKKDLEAAFGARTDATEGLAGALSDELAASYGGYQSWEDQKAGDISKAEKEYKANKETINKLPEAERFKQLQALNEAHQKKMREIDLKYNNMRLQDNQAMFQGFGDAMTAFGLESTAIGKGIFAAQKGLSIAQAMINAHESATKAMATYPGPMGIAMGAASYASAIARVGQMKSIDGMAHDGIDNIPREGTWLLQKGERVVDDRTNGDLKEFLSAQKSNNNSGAAPIEVHAPLQITGNVNSADKMVMDAIKRHAQFVAQAVEDAQRRRM
ncbi:hypothetical protein GRG99_002415 [Salmonella enterica subsp. enterica serovar Virchow]|nr:hypothetical protein [Salmonella enterica subsp. enterica serovar Virchow]